MSARGRDVMTTRVVAVRGGATFKDIVALPIVVTPDEPVTSAARLMYHARVKRLPVVEEGACRLPAILPGWGAIEMQPEQT